MFRHPLLFFVQLGALGLFLLAAADAFLFLPIGTDLLLAVLIARNHTRVPLYVLAASLGSTAGVTLLDLVCRKGGEKGLRRLVTRGQLDRIQARMKKRGTIALIVACVAPPPFPFTPYMAAASAFQFPRPRLLTVVFGARTFRFSLVGAAAFYFGPHILRIMNSSGFVWFIGIFIGVCVVGSAISVIHWFRISRRR